MGRWRGLLPYMSQIVKVARFFEKPVLSLPLGVDQVSTARGRRLAREVLRGLETIYVRDELSAEWAHAYVGPCGPPIQVAADPAYLLPNKPASTHEPQDIDADHLPGSYLAISLVPTVTHD